MVPHIYNIQSKYRIYLLCVLFVLCFVLLCCCVVVCVCLFVAISCLFVFCIVFVVWCLLCRLIVFVVQCFWFWCLVFVVHAARMYQVYSKCVRSRTNGTTNVQHTKQMEDIVIKYHHKCKHHPANGGDPNQMIPTRTKYSDK